MPDLVGSVMRRAAVAACLWLAASVPAFAQTPLPPADDPPEGPQFFPRTAFHLSADALGSGDPRFSWDTHFGGALDMVDYVVGRFSAIADYEAFLGNEFRAFDPNQSIYTLELSMSARAGGTEVAGVFRHVSRHLGDRPKRFAVDWNAIGIRALRHLERGKTSFDMQGSITGVIEHSYVDYSWIGNVDVIARHELNERVGLFAHGFGELYGIDQNLSTRSTQPDGRLEAGLRLNGGAGAVELFAGVERRIDADPIDRLPHGWAFVGFRFVNR